MEHEVQTVRGEATRHPALVRGQTPRVEERHPDVVDGAGRAEQPRSPTAYLTGAPPAPQD